MITAKLDELDYLTAQSINGKWSRKKAIVVILLVIVAVLIGLIWWWQGEWAIAGGIIGGLIGGAIGGSIVRYVYVPWKARRIFQQQKSLQREFTFSWNDNGLHTKDANGGYSSSWSDFTCWKENERLFLVYLSDVQFYMVPKRAFNDEESLNDFRGHLVRSIHV